MARRRRRTASAFCWRLRKSAEGAAETTVQRRPQEEGQPRVRMFSRAEMSNANRLNGIRDSQQGAQPAPAAARRKCQRMFVVVFRCWQEGRNQREKGRRKAASNRCARGRRTRQERTVIASIVMKGTRGSRAERSHNSGEMATAACKKEPGRRSPQQQAYAGGYRAGDPRAGSRSRIAHGVVAAAVVASTRRSSASSF
jgi:hypothetical protein